MHNSTHFRITASLVIVLCLMTGCASEFVMFSNPSGTPTLIARRAYTSNGCVTKVKADAVRLGLTFRYIHVRGNFAGRSLLWPFEPGYACEAAIGTEQLPIGTYSNGRDLLLKGS